MAPEAQTNNIRIEYSPVNSIRSTPGQPPQRRLALPVYDPGSFYNFRINCHIILIPICEPGQSQNKKGLRKDSGCAQQDKKGLSGAIRSAPEKSPCNFNQEKKKAQRKKNPQDLEHFIFNCV